MAAVARTLYLSSNLQPLTRCAAFAAQTLDLSAPSSYRDLSKPVGALSAARSARFRERYSSWDDPLVPPFHYGSHYSSAGTVLYYLLRVEPFTKLAIALQGGRLDHADRLFFDVGATWAGVQSSMADVKELTPEWFYLPEMFVNTNGVDLGLRQTGEAIADVTLPPWAKDAHDFVAQHRAALESDFVSQHLHRWIDLVFGDKQRGMGASDGLRMRSRSCAPSHARCRLRRRHCGAECVLLPHVRGRRGCGGACSPAAC